LQKYDVGLKVSMDQESTCRSGLANRSLGGTAGLLLGRAGGLLRDRSCALLRGRACALLRGRAAGLLRGHGQCDLYQGCGLRGLLYGSNMLTVINTTEILQVQKVVAKLEMVVKRKLQMQEGVAKTFPIAPSSRATSWPGTTPSPFTASPTPSTWSLQRQQR